MRPPTTPPDDREALADFAARRTSLTPPAGDEQAVDLGSALGGALGSRGRSRDGRSGKGLLADSARLDLRRRGPASVVPFSLVLVIDQAEEMFTLANPDGSGLADRDRVLRMLSRVRRGARRHCRSVVSLRRDLGRLIGSLRQGPNGAIGVRDYLLADLDRDALIAFVTLPTSDRPVDHALWIPRPLTALPLRRGCARGQHRVAPRTWRKDGVLFRWATQVILRLSWEAEVMNRGSMPRRGGRGHRDDLDRPGRVRRGPSALRRGPDRGHHSPCAPAGGIWLRHGRPSRCSQSAFGPARRSSG